MFPYLWDTVNQQTWLPVKKARRKADKKIHILEGVLRIEPKPSDCWGERWNLNRPGGFVLGSAISPKGAWRLETSVLEFDLDGGHSGTAAGQLARL
jgi:hypothetical protein